MVLLIEVFRFKTFQSQEAFFEPTIVLSAESCSVWLMLAVFSAAFVGCQRNYVPWHLFLWRGVVLLFFVLSHSFLRLFKSFVGYSRRSSIVHRSYRLVFWEIESSLKKKVEIE